MVKGSEYFVKSASSIAKKYGISEFVIGLTLVAVGTSIPELASSVAASLKHASGIVVGNVVGSNIANIGLIIGISATVATIKTRKEILSRDGYIMVFSSALFLIFALNSKISRIESVLFLLFYLAYISFLFLDKPNFKGEYNFKEFIKFFLKFEYITGLFNRITFKSASSSEDSENQTNLSEKGIVKEVIILIIGLVAVILGAEYLIDQSIYFAQLFGVSEALIGTSLVAVGTSLPELTVTVTASRQGYENIAVGNIIGSNITNVFLILAISGLIFPISVAESALYLSAPFMVFVGALLLVFVATDWEISRSEGLSFLVLYFAFMVVLFLFY